MTDKTLLRLGFVWIAFFVAEAIFPVHGAFSRYSGTAYLVMLVFGAAILLGTTVGKSAMQSLAAHSEQQVSAVLYRRPKLILMSTLVIAGVLMLAYNRMVIQGIDYSQGLAVARELWRTASRNVGTSILGPLGNIFITMATFLHLIAVYSWERLGKAERRVAVFAGFVGLVAQAVFTGGRSFLLIYLSGIFIAESMRRDEARRPLIRVRYLALFMGLAIAYAIYIFQLRAGMNEIPVRLYSERWIGLLGGAGYPAIPDELDLNVTHIAILVFGYLVHSVWTMQEIIAQSLHDGQAMFVFVRMLMSNMGLVDAPLAWERSGYFAPLPGLILHDFGFFAVPLFGLAVGALFSIVRAIFQSTRNATAFLGFVYVGIVLALSPLAFAFDIMLGFYFVVALIAARLLRLI